MKTRLLKRKKKRLVSPLLLFQLDTKNDRGLIFKPPPPLLLLLPIPALQVVRVDTLVGKSRSRSTVRVSGMSIKVESNIRRRVSSQVQT